MASYTTSRRYQHIAWFFIVLFVTELISPNVALALTSGPTQPEVKSFEPVGTTEMVNLFSGDFTYNIPLFEVPGPEGGYPVNLFYNSVTSMDEEASWTGLGWNINIGSLGRMMRGLPDDFSGEEEVARRLDTKPQQRVSVGTLAGIEVLGLGSGNNGSLSLSVSQNFIWDSYKGVGFELGTTLGLDFAKRNSDYQFGGSLGLNLSTLEGTSLNAGFAVSQLSSSNSESKDDDGNPVKTKTTQKGKFNSSLTLSGRDGLTGMTLGYNRSEEIINKTTVDEKERLSGKRSGAGQMNSRLSFAQPTYAPSVGIPWVGFNFSGCFSLAAGASVIYGYGGVQGSYSFQGVAGAGLWQKAKAYGYNYLDKAKGDSHYFMMDFNRVNAGTIDYQTRFLHTPSTTYDIYNVMGQGVGGMYRAHRNEFGLVHDAPLYSATGGVGVGLQAGVLTKVGVDGSLNLAFQSSGRWIQQENFEYGNDDNNATYNVNKEPFYYRVAGDMAAEELDAYDYMGGDEPLRLKRDGYFHLSEFVDDNNASKVTVYNKEANNRDGRQPRSMSVQPIRNDELLDGSGNELLSEYDINYYSTVNSYKNSTPTTALTRASNKQNAGFTVLGNNGVRWIYGLPVMNNRQREVLCSHNYHDPNGCIKNVAIQTENGADSGDRNQRVKYKHANTNEYLDEKNIPAYAHSYMLTSVVGTDYADVDGTPGPSDGDVGYWMKANYVKTADAYQWRAPFLGANYIEGQKNLKDDNSASFMWGEREVYLPASIETKTHIAYFYISQRDDARGAASYIQNTSSSTKHGAHSYKLDKIELYSKQALSNPNATPLKTIHFEYNYELCPDVENNANGGGKLTLKKVWFTYEGSNRGALSPYQFAYHNEGQSPAYDPLKVDRWGVYKDIGAVPACYLLDVPYIERSLSDSILNQQVAAWHIKTITTPSGATINLELERDQYGYVQDKVATEMLRINQWDQPNSRVYFNIDTTIKTQAQLNRYVEDLPVMQNPRNPDNPADLKKQIYLRVKSNLTGNTNGFTESTLEYVPVYAFIRPVNDNEINFELSSGSRTGRAYIELENAKIKTQEGDPISVFSWIYLQNALPQRVFGRDLGTQEPEDLIFSLFAAISSFEALVKGYYKFAKDRGFGKNISAYESFIRLNAPFKAKYGGDIRVKQVTLDDQWDSNQASTIGVTYDYTTTDEEGNTISSGVVENEPPIGYEACALQYASLFYEFDLFQNVNQIHLDLLPLNRSYYPGAKVGYSKVTVRSIASNIAKQALDNPNVIGNNDLAVGFSKTGQTINEFYTCKDFPIITSSTRLSRGAVPPWITQALSAINSILPISHDIQTYTGTQGYNIELNDMHGKPKKIATYAQNADGSIADDPLTYVEYQYHASNRVKTGFNTNDETVVYGLNNEVTVLLDDNPSVGVSTAKKLVGVEQEFFTDTRQNLSFSASAGLNFNVDMVWPLPPITLPIPLPNISVASYITNTAVSNKIIKRHGILRETVAYDGQSRIVTKNLIYNSHTGQPILTSVDNQLGGKIYNYSVPADLAHATMGSAGENWGSSIKGTMSRTTCGNGYYNFTSTTGQPQKLVPGDEYLLTEALAVPIGTFAKKRAVYMGNLNDKGTLTDQFAIVNADGTDATLSTSTNAQVTLKNVRSGNRNLLTATIAQYSTVDTDNSRITPDGNPILNRFAATPYTAQVLSIAEQTQNSQQVAMLTPTSGPSVPYQTINNVLSASANAYRDHWTMEAYNICNLSPVKNPYLLGEQGVWRMESSYAYVADRAFKTIDTSSIVDIKTSGVVDNVPLFNWKDPFFEYCSNNWIRTEDITQYNRDGDPIEARDVIGNYQAEIYGLNDNLVIAKGANARYYELGFESFEEPNQTGSIQSIANTGYYSEGNLNFFPQPANCQTTDYRPESYRLSYPMAQPNGSNISYVLVRQPYTTAAASDPNRSLERLTLMLHNSQGQQHKVVLSGSQVQALPVELAVARLQVPGLGIVLDATTKAEFTVYKVDFGGAICLPDLSQSSWWVGHATLAYAEKLVAQGEIHNPSFPGCAQVVNTDAHTGNHALKIFDFTNENTNSVCPKVIFPQRSLHLEAGQEYILSFWMSKYSDKLYTLGELGFSYANDNYYRMRLGNITLEPDGPMIEGWQKVEQKFTYTGNPADKTLIFETIALDGRISPLLIDDVRIFPADGAIQTYVYDPVDYKLRATLDDNNYATFYIYNPEGDLIAVKRETERGIKTIQESRNFIKPTN